MMIAATARIDAPMMYSIPSSWIQYTTIRPPLHRLGDPADDRRQGVHADDEDDVPPARVGPREPPGSLGLREHQIVPVLTRTWDVCYPILTS